LEERWIKSRWESKREFLADLRKSVSPLSCIVFNDPWGRGRYRIKFCAPDRKIVEPFLRKSQLPYHSDPHRWSPWSPAHVDWIGIYVKEFGGKLFFLAGRPKRSWLSEEDVFLPPYQSFEAIPSFFDESFRGLRKAWRKGKLKSERNLKLVKGGEEDV